VRTPTRVGSALLVAVVVATWAHADRPPADRRNFVACPIVRDTATVPCWLAEYDGELYYLGIQTDVSADFDPPYLGHQALIEGRVKDADRICGGIVLEPVNVSVLPELDGSCNTILPADDRYTVPFAPRPPGPSGGRLAFEGAAPQRDRPGPEAPAGEFELFYDYSMLIMGRHSPLLGKILGYAQEIDARRITITGFAGASLLSNGERLVEDPALAEQRAAEVADVLHRAGIDTAVLHVEGAAGGPSDVDGIDDWRTRKTVVVVEP
jgi:hypothetical protein